jgi:F0F1-type ATP synthase assembly protein I
MVNKTKYKIKNFKDVAQVIAVLSVFFSGVIIGLFIGIAKYVNINKTLGLITILSAFMVMIIGTLIIFISTQD